MNKIDELLKQVKAADAIVVGGGSGMSNAAGMDFWYSASPLFMKYMKPYYDKYHFEGIFKGYYTPFDSKEEKWAFMLYAYKLIFNEPPQKPTYEYLKTVIGNKPVHYVNTNQDGLFKKYFGEDAVSEIQGSWSFMQSSNPETDKNLYDAKKIVKELLPKIKNYKLDSQYFPKSPINDAELIAWVRGPQFLEDKRYNYEYKKFNKFLAKHKGEKILFIEMGVGRMTPMFIQEPFWDMTQYMKDSFYININPKDALTNPVIRDRSLLIGDDINEVLKEAAAKIKEEKHD
ncbi:SIR2 family NAD-dependent protein deacylase [Lactobacillus ultunensis]|uniref:Sir2 silent information regulator family NAD-dependent deacetylase n=1 Tax=Lactobacillus ultunensis TaxID=227945 RepID=UPI0019132F2E|nr:Sir2 silent information regulator family NAD-dependent deacetylase [Lactobacillus ultunensis]QQP27682.1 Sir2 silent information regulator family NAD-dependent deacetylase [Lactobacillus ultunensis]